MMINTDGMHPAMGLLIQTLEQAIDRAGKRNVVSLSIGDCTVDTRPGQCYCPVTIRAEHKKWAVLTSHEEVLELHAPLTGYEDRLEHWQYACAFYVFRVCYAIGLWCVYDGPDIDIAWLRPTETARQEHATEWLTDYVTLQHKHFGTVASHAVRQAEHRGGYVVVNLYDAAESSYLIRADCLCDEQSILHGVIDGLRKLNMLSATDSTDNR